MLKHHTIILFAAVIGLFMQTVSADYQPRA
jgi:hypothetical protein